MAAFWAHEVLNVFVVGFCLWLDKKKMKFDSISNKCVLKICKFLDILNSMNHRKNLYLRVGRIKIIILNNLLPLKRPY